MQTFLCCITILLFITKGKTSREKGTCMDHKRNSLSQFPYLISAQLHKLLSQAVQMKRNWKVTKEHMGYKNQIGSEQFDWAVCQVTLSGFTPLERQERRNRMGWTKHTSLQFQLAKTGISYTAPTTKRRRSRRVRCLF